MPPGRFTYGHPSVGREIESEERWIEHLTAQTEAAALDRYNAEHLDVHARQIDRNAAAFCEDARAE